MKRSRGQEHIVKILSPVLPPWKDKGESICRWWIFSPAQAFYIKWLMWFHTVFAYSIVVRSGVVPASDLLIQTILLIGLTLSWLWIHLKDPGCLPSSAKHEYTEAIAEMYVRRDLPLLMISNPISQCTCVP